MSTPLRAQDRLITAEEFAELPSDTTRRCELVRGVVCEVAYPHHADHGLVTSQICYLLHSWNDGPRLGRLRASTGFVLARNPDTVRGADVSFVRRVRDGDVDGPWIRGGADLVVEVRESLDRPGEIDERVSDYLRAGTPLVWIVDPRARTVVVRTPGTPDRTLTADDILDGGDVLPGFRVPVREVFEDLEGQN